MIAGLPTLIRTGADGIYLVIDGSFRYLSGFDNLDAVATIAEVVTVFRLVPDLAPRAEEVVVLTSGVLENEVHSRVLYALDGEETRVLSLTHGSIGFHETPEGSPLVTAAHALLAAVRMGSPVREAVSA